jgi:hypothetical protein
LDETRISVVDGNVEDEDEGPSKGELSTNLLSEGVVTRCHGGERGKTPKFRKKCLLLDWRWPLTSAGTRTVKSKIIPNRLVIPIHTDMHSDQKDCFRCGSICSTNVRLQASRYSKISNDRDYQKSNRLFASTIHL